MCLRVWKDITRKTGRAGRDGLEGDCLLFYNPADIEKLEKFMKDKPVSERENRRATDI
jgi:ATP-dependent DNA helicase RecQ